MRKMRVVLCTFLCGLLAGILLPNLVESSALRMSCLSDLMMLQRYLNEPMDGRELLIYLLRSRGILLGLCGVFGIAIFGVPMSLFCTAMSGFTVGGILTTSILTGGIWGFLLGVGILLPQYLIYLPAGLSLYHASFQMSVKCWKNVRMSSGEYRQYFLRIIMLWGLLFVGMVLESYINPGVIRLILNFF